jgi:hypothetical protein
MDSYVWKKGDSVLGGQFFVFYSGTYEPSELVAVSRTPHCKTSSVSFQAHYLATGEHL